MTTADAASLPLSRGRADVARRVLEPLPDLIREAVTAAYVAGQDAGVEAARKAPSPVPPAGGRPAVLGTATLLEAHMRRLGVRRVVEALGVRLADLPPLLEGRWASARQR